MHRRDEVIRRSEARPLPIAVEQRPVLEVRVAIADCGVEENTTDELPEIAQSAIFEPDEEPADAVHVGGPVLRAIIGMPVEHLEKILHVNTARLGAIEATDQQGLWFSELELFGQSTHVGQSDQPRLRDLDADETSPAHHRKLVVRDAAVVRVRNLQQPPAPLSRHRQNPSPGVLDNRELQLETRDGEAERVLDGLGWIRKLVGDFSFIRRQWARGLDHDSAWQVLAELCEKEELTRG